MSNQSVRPPYIGRFAPSPSGPLHFGSLVCALASYLDAKHYGGEWLLRIEDIDPPREQLGATDSIKTTLEAHGLFWDGEIRYQSRRSEAYCHWIERLRDLDLIYPCQCTRARLSQLEGPYDGHCRRHPPLTAPVALRLKLDDLPTRFQNINPNIQFIDRICGPQYENLISTSGDYIIFRKDGFFAYQLAVVIDDIDQGITDIVRGDDLLDTTARQIFLYHLLGKTPPSFAHIPVILDPQSRKLSKQNHAPAVDNSIPALNLKRALLALKIPCEQAFTISDLLKIAISTWHLKR